MQGMTVQRTVVKLNDRFFASGQAYVALSCVKHLKDLVLCDYCQFSIHILKFYKDLLEWCDCVDAIRPTPTTQMVPYPERADDVSDTPLHADTDQDQQNAYMMFLDYLDECEKGTYSS